MPKLYYTKTNQGIYPAYQEHVVMCEDNLISATGTVYVYPAGWVTALNPKLKINILIDGVLRAVLSKPFDSKQRANFHVQDIIQDYCETDITEYITGATDSNREQIHKIPKYSKNNNNLHKVEFEAVLEYRSSITGNIVTQTQGVAAQATNNSGSGRYNTHKFFWNGTRQHRNGEVLDMTNYIGTASNTAKLLTDYATGANADRQKIRKTDYHTVAFFNGTYKRFDTDSDIQAGITASRLISYNAAGASIFTFTHNNTSAQGGEVPTTTMTAENGILYRGTGIQNMIDAGLAAASNFEVGGYYRWDFLDAGNNEIYKTVFFDVVDENCKGFETIRLAWVNSLGAWDYYNFTKRSTRSTRSRRTNYKQDYGFTQDNVFNAYDYNTNQGGVVTFNNEVTQSIEANSDFISEETAATLESLFTSPVVQMQNADGNYENVIVIEKEYVQQTKANDKVIQYVIEIQYSHNKTVQRI